MALDGGSVQAVEIAPPIDAKPDRVPLTDAHRRNVVDPLSAFLMPVSGKGGLTAACNRTLPIFDGAARYDIKLSHSGTREVKMEGYSGPVADLPGALCPDRRPSRAATQHQVHGREQGHQHLARAGRRHQC